MRIGTVFRVPATDALPDSDMPAHIPAIHAASFVRGNLVAWQCHGIFSGSSPAIRSPRRGTPAWGGLRAHRSRLRKDRSPRHSRHSMIVRAAILGALGAVPWPSGGSMSHRSREAQWLARALEFAGARAPIDLHLAKPQLDFSHHLSRTKLLQVAIERSHSVGKFSLGYQPTTEHRMDQREELTFRRRNVAIHCVSKLVFSSAPIKSRQRPADCQTLVHSDQTCFPRWVRIGDAVARRDDIPLLPFAPYGLKEVIGLTSTSLLAFIPRPLGAANFRQGGGLCGSGERLSFDRVAAGQRQSCSLV